MTIFRAMTSILVVAYFLPHMMLDEYTRHRLLFTTHGAWRIYSSSLTFCHTWCLTSILVIAYFLSHMVLDEYTRHRLLSATHGAWRVYSSSLTFCHTWCLTSILVIAYFLPHILGTPFPKFLKKSQQPIDYGNTSSINTRHSARNIYRMSSWTNCKVQIK